MILHCVACILYNSDQMPDLEEQFLINLVNYSTCIDEYYTKQSINWVICALLSKKPNFIHSLTSMIDLKCLASNVGINSKLSNTGASNTKRTLCLIETLSYAVQSDEAVRLFIKSNFFTEFASHFVDALVNFKTNKRTQIDLNFIRVFLALSQYEHGQEWFGTEQGCSLWQRLIDMLNNSYETSKLAHLEEITLLSVRLIKKMLFNNTINQTKFSQYITRLIRDASCPVNFYIDPSSYNALNFNSSPTISAFLHQLILQIMLEDQTIVVNFQRKSSLFKSSCNSSLGQLTHPKFGTGSNFRTLEIPLTKTCAQLLNSLSDLPIPQILAAAKTTNNSESTDSVYEMKDFLTKLKAESSSASSFKPSSGGDGYQLPRIKLYLKEHDGRERPLRNEYSLNRVLDLYLTKSNRKVVQDLTLVVKLSYDSEHSSGVDLTDVEATGTSATTNFISSPLDAFVKCDGLIVLAERLPILMPFIHEPLLNVTDKDRMNSQLSDQPKTSPDFVDYVIMNESDGPFVDEMYNEIPISSQSSATGANKLKKITMPLHAFIAFGLFLKIPGYASVMLRNRRQAQCILKLLLGANRNKEEDYSLSLSTMPFASLKDLLNDMIGQNDTATQDQQQPTTTKLQLTMFIFENRILTLILSILSNLSHHPHRQTSPHFSHKMIPDNYMYTLGGEHTAGAGQFGPQATGAGAAGVSGLVGAGGAGGNSEDKNSLYWAKGTGFGTGSTMQQWDAEKTLMQQKMEEEHVSCILEILSCYIQCLEENVNDAIIELFDHSCVINALSSYLRNDSGKTLFLTE